ncbi:MAG: epoxide hydrolase family protein [Pseudolysinimonas sp.]
MAIEPFTIDIADEVLDDLRGRLLRTRFATPSDPEPGRAGFDPGYLRELVERWHDGFDWRAREGVINAYPQFRTTGAAPLHFIHARAAEATHAVPIVLLHGWPSSFLEMLPLVDRLTAAGHDVVVPSLPGFAFSALQPGFWTRNGTAALIHDLMSGELGYARYGAFGGDIGGTVAAWLGALYPQSVAAIHMIHPPFPASFDVPPLTAEEQAFLDAEEAFDETDGGYSAIMITRPDTIAAALLDSPSGLLAWIADKWRDWSDCDGNLRSRLADDELLTLATLYWVSGSIGTSARQYYDYDHGAARPAIDVPAAFTLSHEPGMTGFPRSIAERACSNIVRWNEPGRGGHFLAWEEPDLMAEELRATFG